MFKKINELDFPNPNDVNVEGMTLRDYFAAKAMQATLIHGKTLYEEHDAFFHIENVVEDSYYIANAMLKKGEIER